MFLILMNIFLQFAAMTPFLVYNFLEHDYGRIENILFASLHSMRIYFCELTKKRDEMRGEAEKHRSHSVTFFSPAVTTVPNAENNFVDPHAIVRPQSVERPK